MPQETAANQRLIVALDVGDADVARKLVVELSPFVGGFKVGYQLGYSIGFDRAAELVRSAGGKIFIDAKLSDIPNTVGAGMAALAKQRPWMVTVHASAGVEAMRAAVENRGDSFVLAVTVLTALSDEDCKHIFGMSAKDKVVQFARDAAAAKVAGLVCSPQDLQYLTGISELNGLLRVTPGVRPVWSQTNDQQRVMTPAAAIQAGADYLVIGRPITNPPSEVGSPAAAAQRIVEEIANGQD